jgi:hypothetical protein
MGGEGKGGSHSVKLSTRPRYGHGMAVRMDGVRRRRHWAGGGMVGATSPVRAWHVAQGERAGKVVQHGRSHSARSSGR